MISEAHFTAGLITGFLGSGAMEATVKFHIQRTLGGPYSRLLAASS